MAENKESIIEKNDEILLTDEDKKLIELEKALESFSSENYSLIVARYDEDGNKITLPSMKNLSCNSLDQIFDEIRKRYMKGVRVQRFYIQIRTKTSFSKGTIVWLENPNYEESKQVSDNSGQSQFQREIESLKTMILMNQQNKMEWLKEMEVYRNMFTNPNGSSSVDPSRYISDMTNTWKQALSLGQSMVLQQKEEDGKEMMAEVFKTIVPTIGEVVKSFMNRNQKVVHVPSRQTQQVNNPDPKTEETVPQTEKQEPIEDIEKKEMLEAFKGMEKEEMKIILLRGMFPEYFTLFDMVKNTAVEQNIEIKETMISTIFDYILNYCPVLIKSFNQLQSLDQGYEELKNRFQVEFSQQEKEIISIVYERLKEFLNESNAN